MGPAPLPAGARPPARRGPIGDFVAGVGLLGRGLAIYGRSPGLVLLGIVPALVTAAVVVAAIVALVTFIDPITAVLTGFAGHWPAAARHSLRQILAIAIVGVAVLLAIVTFTSLTLAIGDPFYEKISERVENRLGGAPNLPSLPWWREMIRNLGDAVRLLSRSAIIGVLLLLGGLIPVVGQTAVPVIGALFGGWALAVELTGPAFARRGLYLAQRRRVLRQHRFLAAGFGVAVFVCFLIPFAAVLLMPAAVAGATLLSRRALGVPDHRPVPVPRTTGYPS